MEKKPVAEQSDAPERSARRKFLEKAAAYGIATPAAVTLLLAAAAKRKPVAAQLMSNID